MTPRNRDFPQRTGDCSALAGMQQHYSPANAGHRPAASAAPLYPVPVGDYVVKPREVVKIAGQPFVRTPDGEWLLVDRADVAVTETDD